MNTQFGMQIKIAFTKKLKFQHFNCFIGQLKTVLFTMNRP